MGKGRTLGYTLVVVGLMAIGALVAYYQGHGMASLREYGPWIVTAGALAFAYRAKAAAAWMFVARRTTAERVAGRDPAASMEGFDAANADATQECLNLLKAQLGAGPARRLPRLLVIGDAGTVGRVAHGLPIVGSATTPHAILIWGGEARPALENESWLRGIYRLRRTRAVDGVVLVTAGNGDLREQARNVVLQRAALVTIRQILRWSAPVWLLNVVEAEAAPAGAAPVAACPLPRAGSVPAVEACLDALKRELVWRGVSRLIASGRDRYVADLAHWLDSSTGVLASWIAGLADARQIALRGVAFTAPRQDDSESNDDAHFPLWEYLAGATSRQPGRPMGSNLVAAGTIAALTVIGVLVGGMILSALSTAREVHGAQRAVAAIQEDADPAARLRALLALQQQIGRYEVRLQSAASPLVKFGLNRDPEILAALWKPYATASRALLVAPAAASLEAALTDLGRLPLTRLDEQTSRWALGGHDALKAYLMLADPERADADFLRAQLPRHWSTEARITPGEKLDLAERLFAFHAAHLKANPDWRIAPQAALVAGARQTLLAVIGERNAQDTIYRGVIEGVGNKYPDQTLASLTPGTDARGLLRATATVPGAFTRQAYDGHVAAAIEQAGKRMEIASDWVLGDGPSPGAALPVAGDVAAALAQQYFTEYADHWQRFMNTLQWVPASTLSASAEQLKLAADARQSPVIALMKSLEYHGGAGARREALSDALVAKAQDLMGRKANVPEALKADPAGPLGAAFGPVLRLVGQTQPAAASGAGDLSLQRFLDRTTALRLRLQQLGQSADGDAQARQMAQALFQGKGSELAEMQAYAQLMAASLGAQWAGMGEALFVRPIAQATQAVLQPAQASMNEAWREGIVTNWYRAFAGRYPFADTQNDASLAELSRFLKPQGGSIPTFLGAHLAGVLVLQGERWTPVEGNALTFDPAFLTALNTLQRIANRMMVHDDAQYRFELKPVPTPGLVDTVLTLDGQQLHYYNQRETWHPMRWPAGDPQAPLARLQWQTEAAGTSKDHEFIGRWALLRLLERAHVEPLDSATFQLTWQARPDTSPLPDTAGAAGPEEAGEDAERLTPREPLLTPPADITHPLRYLMRTEAGLGPLDLLALRGFTLPARLFVGATDRRT